VPKDLGFEVALNRKEFLKSDIDYLSFSAVLFRSFKMITEIQTLMVPICSRLDAFKTQIGYDTKGTQQVDSKMQRGTESKKKTYHQEGRSGHQIDRHLYGQFARKKTKEEMVLPQSGPYFGHGTTKM
jgi:hypothetical protein